MSTDTAAAADAPAKTKRQVYAYAWAIDLNRETASKLAESPTVTLGAAVLAFAALDPETQYQLTSQARSLQAAAGRAG